MMNNTDWYENDTQQHFSAGDKKSKGAKMVTLSTLVVCMLVTGLVGGAVGSVLMRGGQTPIQTPAAVETPGAQDNAQGSGSTTQQTQSSLQQAVSPTVSGSGYTKAQIVETCAPSIVGIDVETTSSSFWYGTDSVTTGSGSGIIISSDGYILTNYHVIEGANRVKVYLYDDTEYEATLVGTDKTTDLAVIKVEATGLTPVVMGDSDHLIVGEEVVAIGNPLGELRGTATGGMVSALSRDITFSDGSEMTLLQTDAAINPGNSGGGLFNSKGELIGIVNAKVASSSTEGLGFAIPVNDAKQVVADLMDLGYVTGRAYLGVYTQDVAIRSGNEDGRGNSGFDSFFGFGGSSGSMETRVQVAQIVLDSAAAQAGIQAGDLILKVDDKEITTGTQLSKAIGEYKAGDVATITVQRNNEQLELSVTFGELVPEGDD